MAAAWLGSCAHLSDGPLESEPCCCAYEPSHTGDSGQTAPHKV